MISANGARLHLSRPSGSAGQILVKSHADPANKRLEGCKADSFCRNLPLNNSQFLHT